MNIRNIQRLLQPKTTSERQDPSFLGVYIWKPFIVWNKLRGRVDTCRSSVDMGLLFCIRFSKVSWWNFNFLMKFSKDFTKVFPELSVPQANSNAMPGNMKNNVMTLWILFCNFRSQIRPSLLFELSSNESLCLKFRHSLFESTT